MTNTVVISAEEYRKLICTECAFNDLLGAVAKAEGDNIKLKDFILNTIVSNYKMNDRGYTVDELTDPTNYGFPFEFRELVSAGISVEYAINWIKRKKEEEQENDHDGTEE